MPCKFMAEVKFEPQTFLVLLPLTLTLQQLIEFAFITRRMTFESTFAKLKIKTHVLFLEASANNL